jgi:outer membrane protein assembly factor BamB
MKYNYLFITIFFVTSCSTVPSFGLFDNDIDPDEPAILKNIEDEKAKLKINWSKKYKGENLLGNFSPSFSSKSLFFGDQEGNIDSLNAKSGDSLWSFKHNKEITSGISAGFGSIIFADEDGEIINLNQSDGTLIWKKNIKTEVLTAMPITAKYIIIKSSSGDLIALDKFSADVVWSYRSVLPSLTVRGSSMPVIEQDKIYTTFDNGRLSVFELNNGFPLWDGAISYTEGTSDLENLIDSDASPVVDGRLIYANNFQGNLAIFDSAQKRMIWKTKSSSFYSPLLLRNMMILTEYNSIIRSFSTKTFSESWKSEEYKNRNLSNAINFKGNIIFGDDKGFIHILDPLNGITIGRIKISKKPIKTLISRSDSFYAVDENFELFSLSSLI